MPDQSLPTPQPPSQAAPCAPSHGSKICDEAYCRDCGVIFNPTGEEDNDPPEHGECEGTNTEWRGSWHAPA